MKIATIVGARPQFIKAARISHFLRQEHHEILIHTGQHYDYNMSEIFFDEMEIPRPDYNLGISGGSHGKMTGAMLGGIEEILTEEKPDMLLVYGDTNSTLAGALAAVKLNIPVCHAEAGNRLGTLDNPEEVNRICTDHVSSLLLCCVRSAYEFLAGEGLEERARIVGDPMYDAFLYYSNSNRNKGLKNELETIRGKKFNIPDEYYYLTCHRQENTSKKALGEILNAAESLDAPTIYPVHPRNSSLVEQICEEQQFSNIILTNPVGYLSSVELVKNARRILTDSGGVQREAFFAAVPCVTIFDHVVWPETMRGQQNQLAKADKQDILDKLAAPVTRDEDYAPFGDGHAAEKIVSEIAAWQANAG